MCGRTVCSRAPSDLCRACGRKTKDGKWSQPRWREPPGGQKYYTSYNTAPSSHTPVLLSRHHLTGQEQETCSNLESMEEAVTMETGVAMEMTESDCVVQPMHWGLVPFWHTGDTKGTGYNMTNARSDSILEKRSFKVPLEKGRRCVILADGYYEWQNKEGEKQPYYIYPSPDPGSKVKAEVKTEVKEDTNGKVKADVKTEVKEDTKVKEKGAVVEKVKDEGVDEKIKQEVKSETPEIPKLLMMAGLFDVWKPKDGEPLYSYSIITVDAHPDMAWIHDRMPAVLVGDEEVQAWLDYGSVPLKKAMDLIKPKAALQCHPVDKAVGNVHNKTPDLVKPIDLEKVKAKSAASRNFMAAWLGKGGVKDARKRSVSESDKVRDEVRGPRSEVKEEGDEPTETKKLRMEDN